MMAQCQDCFHHFQIDPRGDVQGAACPDCGGKRMFMDQPSPTQSDGTLRDMVDSETQKDQGGNPLGEGTIMGNDGEVPLMAGGRGRDNYMHGSVIAALAEHATQGLRCPHCGNEGIWPDPGHGVLFCGNCNNEWPVHHNEFDTETPINMPTKRDYEYPPHLMDQISNEEPGTAFPPPNLGPVRHGAIFDDDDEYWSQFSPEDRAFHEKAEHEEKMARNPAYRRANEWTCPKCGAPNGQIYADCDNCGELRPTESFPNSAQDLEQQFQMPAQEHPLGPHTGADVMDAFYQRLPRERLQSPPKTPGPPPQYTPPHQKLFSKCPNCKQPVEEGGSCPNCGQLSILAALFDDFEREDQPHREREREIREMEDSRARERNRNWQNHESDREQGNLPCPNCGKRGTHPTPDSQSLYCPNCEKVMWIPEDYQQTYLPGELEHPDPGMDNEPGSLTIPQGHPALWYSKTASPLLVPDEQGYITKQKRLDPETGAEIEEPWQSPDRQWQPGQRGRGLVINGVPHTWSHTQGEYALPVTHSDYVKERGIDPKAVDWMSGVEIDPDGTVVALGGHDAAPFIQTDPRMKLAENPFSFSSVMPKYYDRRTNNMEPYEPLWAKEADVLFDKGPDANIPAHTAEATPGRAGIHNGPLHYLSFLDAHINGVPVRGNARDLFMQYGMPHSEQFGQPVTVSVHDPSHVGPAVEQIEWEGPGPAPQMKELGQAVQRGEAPPPPGVDPSMIAPPRAGSVRVGEGLVGDVAETGGELGGAAIGEAVAPELGPVGPVVGATLGKAAGGLMSKVMGGGQQQQAPEAGGQLAPLSSIHEAMDPTWIADLAGGVGMALAPFGIGMGLHHINEGDRTRKYQNQRAEQVHNWGEHAHTPSPYCPLCKAGQPPQQDPTPAGGMWPHLDQFMQDQPGTETFPEEWTHEGSAEWPNEYGEWPWDVKHEPQVDEEGRETVHLPPHYPNLLEYLERALPDPTDPRHPEIQNAIQETRDYLDHIGYPRPAGNPEDPRGDVLAAFLGHYETPSSNPDVGVKHDDPEEVDQKEFNDQDKSPKNLANPETGTPGAGVNSGEDNATGESSFKPDSPGIKMLEELMPLVLEYYHSDKSGAEHPMLKTLHDALEAEVPGYMDKPDFDTADKFVTGLRTPEHVHANVPAIPGVTDETSGVAMPTIQMNNQSRCSACGGALDGTGGCAQCGMGQGNLPQQQQSLAPMSPAPGPGGPQTPGPIQSQPPTDRPKTAANHQGPVTPEQIAAVQQYLIAHGRAHEAPNVELDPGNPEYAKILAEIQGKPNVPPTVSPEEQTPPPPPQGAMPGAPGGGMPMPGMAPGEGQQPMQPMSSFLPELVFESSDNVAERCPQCGSSTTGMVGDDDHTQHCHSCGHKWKLEHLYDDAGTAGTTSISAVLALVQDSEHVHQDQQKNPFGVPAAEQDAPADQGGNEDNSMTWQDTSGQQIEPGHEYIMHNPGFDIPDMIRVKTRKPDGLHVEFLGTYSNEPQALHFDDDISREEVESRKISFEPVPQNAEEQQQEEPPPGRAAPGEETVPPSGQTTDEHDDSYPPYQSSIREDKCPKCGHTDGDTTSTGHRVHHASAMITAESSEHECGFCGGTWITKEAVTSSDGDLGHRAWIMDDDDTDEWSDRMAAMAKAKIQSRNLGDIAARDPRLQEIRDRLDKNPRVMDKIAGRHFTPGEQRTLIDEDGIARNADLMRLEGTHYKSSTEYDKLNAENAPDEHMTLMLGL